MFILYLSSVSALLLDPQGRLSTDPFKSCNNEGGAGGITGKQTPTIGKIADAANRIISGKPAHNVGYILLPAV